MLAFDNIPEIDSNELKKFGLSLAGIIAAIFGVVFAFIGGEFNIWPWILSASIIIWALFHSESLVLIYKPLMFISNVIGHLVSTLILFLIFFLLVTPIGLIMRLIKKPESKPEWIDSPNPLQSDYERPY